MNDPKYLISIIYKSTRIPMQTLQLVGGVTQSVMGYTGSEYYLASMPEVGIYATGVGYVDSLNNLLLVATSSTPEPGFPPLNR